MSDTKCSLCNGTGMHTNVFNNKYSCPRCNGYGFDCINTKEIVCPYCGEEFIDSWECDKNMEHHITVDCQYCCEKFEVECEYNVTYTSKKQD